eukprot:scaffold39210_cov63-Phaeocystis_antarctica.AAC.1
MKATASPGVRRPRRRRGRWVRAKRICLSGAAVHAVPRENACPSKRQNVVLLRDIRHVVKVYIHPGGGATNVRYLGVKSQIG